ncbi:MAG: CIA30 family protein [Bacteroidota bacterium]
MIPLSWSISLPLLLTLLMGPRSTPEAPPLRIDFGRDTGGQNWAVLNDGVMGGLSVGDATLTDSSLVFTGTVSLDNFGGFTSVKGPFERTDLSAFETVRVRYRCQGQVFALTLEMDERFFVPYYRGVLEPASDEWRVAVLPLAAFEQYNLGRPTGTRFERDVRADVLRLGLITIAKQEGPFELELDYIVFE